MPTSTTRLSGPRARLAPLVLATMASQALLVVLSATIAAIAGGLHASVGAVGQARSVTAVVAIATSVGIATRANVLGTRRLIRFGAVIAVVACAAVAAAPTLPVLLAAHVMLGVGFACLLSAGFGGVASFGPERRAWALGFVTAGNPLAWIVVTPLAGAIAEHGSWRLAQAIPAVIAIAALAASRAASSGGATATAPRLRRLAAAGSARRWIGAELLAYGAWTALLTYVGAYFVTGLGVRETTAGWLLAAGAAAHFAASTRGGRLAARIPRRRLVAGAALAMAALVPLQLGVPASVPVAGLLFCLVALAAGVRTPASSGLGLEQLPDSPGAMMAVRTATTQLGYLLGAVVGGAVIAAEGYAALGVLLGLGMAISAALVMRVRDPAERAGAGLAPHRRLTPRSSP